MTQLTGLARAGSQILERHPESAEQIVGEAEVHVPDPRQDVMYMGLRVADEPRETPFGDLASADEPPDMIQQGLEKLVEIVRRHISF